MKKLLFIAICSCFVLTSYGQIDFDRVYGGASLGYAAPVGDFDEAADGGFTYNLEGGYMLTDKIGVGLSYVSALTASIDESLESGLFGLSLYGLNTYMAKGWYKFLENDFSPFVGVGLGLGQVQEPDIEVNGQTIDGENQFGLGAQIEAGISIRGFTLTYSFNMAGRTPSETALNAGEDVAANYHRFALGYLYNF